MATVNDTAGHESAAHDIKQEGARGYRKTRRGYVTSDKMDKTITVEVEDGSSTLSTARSSAVPRRSRLTTS